MSDAYADIFREYSRPLDAIPTGETPIWAEIPGIRAVLFDLYGTLVISASGEVGTSAQRAGEPDNLPKKSAFPAALKAVGIPLNDPLAAGHEHLFRVIDDSHARSSKEGIDHPEVDICTIWQSVLHKLASDGLIESLEPASVDLKRLAIEYEVRANPCWPMPHVVECLEALRGKGLLLGIISNAQFYASALFEVLLGSPAEELGFERDLQFFSYRHGLAKPGLVLFEMAAEALRRRGISPGETLYVGNDMLNDVLPGCKLGFHTALFAGDRRSLRRREGDRRLDGIKAELVLTDLGQLADCV